MDEWELKRFMAKVRKQETVTSLHVDTPCWLWTGAPHQSGYGRYGKRLAHRIAHKHWNGPLGEFQCLHRCDTPLCVNPDHLFAGTRDDNMADMVAKGRAALGIRNGRSRFTRSDVVEIRRRLAEGVTQTALAKEHGVTKNAIWEIAHRKTWRHLPEHVTRCPICERAGECPHDWADAEQRAGRSGALPEPRPQPKRGTEAVGDGFADGWGWLDGAAPYGAREAAE